jgi:phenylpyruvate tautomerase PptA (4-oxalocrotonate tautomerase family)
MPYLRIDTNVTLDKPAADDLCVALSAAAAQWLGKPEQYVLACVRPGLSLTHGGTAEPAAYAECKSIGLPKKRTEELSAALCGFLQERLDMDPARVYIAFKDLERSLFGWNGRTF